MNFSSSSNVAGFFPTAKAAVARTDWMVAGSGAQLQIVIRKVRVGLMCQVPFSQDSASPW